MIKPNSIYSHNWHVQPNCQRSLRDIRLSEALLDRGPTFRLSCPRTCCACRPYFSALTGFLCNFLRIPNLNHTVKLNLFLRRGRPTHCWRSILACEFSICLTRKAPAQKVSHCAKYQTTTRLAQAARACRRYTPGSRNGLFSLGIPYRGPGALASPDPTN